MHIIAEKGISKLQTIKRNRLVHKLIKPDGLVLEVGSGNSPMNISEVLLDKYVSSTEVHRSNKQGISKFQNKPFILGDGAKLPFKDKSIDTIICRHVIEHVDDPVAFVQELQRVGRKGYLEWPSIFCELIKGGYGAQNSIQALFTTQTKKYLEALEHGKGTVGHRWFIVPIGPRLYFVGKNKEQYPIYLLYGAYAKSDINKKQFNNLLRVKNSYIIWSENNPIEAVILSEAKHNDVAESINEYYNVSEQINYLKNMPASCIKDATENTQIANALCCPICREGELKKISNQFYCTGCKSYYPFINGVPVLLEQASNNQKCI